MLLGSSARPARKFMSRVCAKVLIMPEGAFLNVLFVLLISFSKGRVMWEVILNK